MKKTWIFSVLALVGTLAAGAVLAASGSTYVKVYSCRQLSNGVAVRVVTTSPEGKLLNGTKNAGSGLRSYTYNCVTGKNGTPATSSAWYLTRWADATTTDRVAPTMNFSASLSADAGNGQGYKYSFNVIATDATSPMSLIEIALRNPDTGVWSVVTSSRAATTSTNRTQVFIGERGYLQYQKTYQIKAYARDSLGNIGQSQIVTLMIPQIATGKLLITPSTTLDRIVGAGQNNVVLGQWNLSAVNENIRLSKITFQIERPNGGGNVTFLDSFALFELYDGSVLLGQVFTDGQGALIFSNLNTTVTAGTIKTLTLKGDTMTDPYFYNNGMVVDFAIKSDASDYLQAIGAASNVSLSVNDINSTGVETNFSHSARIMSLSTYPVINGINTFGNFFLGAQTQVFKFNVFNPGLIDLRLSTTTVTVYISGLTASGAATGTIGNFRLWESNGSNGLGLALASSTNYYTNNGEINIDFGPANDVNSAMDSLLVSPLSMRTFVVTANTTNIMLGAATGTIAIQPVIKGNTGYQDGVGWFTGNMKYYFEQILGGENFPAYSWSDSYPAYGNTQTIIR